MNLQGQPNLQLPQPSSTSSLGQLPLDYLKRLSHVVDQSWLILKSRFLQKRHEILLEASFQHYFAHILSEYGDLCCTRREDLFLVDLESRFATVTGGRKYIDVTCSFNKHVGCAIELKFKTKKQAAQDHGRIDAFCDIAFLERACQSVYDFGRFYMITDCTGYVNPSRKGVGVTFAMHNGQVTTAGTTYHHPRCKGRENVSLTLAKSYKFDWEKIGNWYFLALEICR